MVWVIIKLKGNLEKQSKREMWFAPNEKHWHGAASHKAMSHIAIQEEVGGEVVTWREKVSDSECSKQKQEKWKLI